MGAAPFGIVVAVAADLVIGRDGDLPWHHPEDLKHFKRTTLGHCLVMGRGTWESFGSKPLPRRRHLVVSRRAGRDPDGLERDGALWFASLQGAVDWWTGDDDGPEDERLFVIGGGQVFAEVLAEGRPLPDPLVITWVPAAGRRDGDVLFPVDRDWVEARYEAARSWTGETGDLEFVEYRPRER